MMTTKEILFIGVIVAVVIFIAVLIFNRMLAREKRKPDSSDESHPVDNDLRAVLEHEIERTKEDPLRSVLHLGVYDVNNEVTADPEAYEVGEGMQKCPVCGKVISADLEICPHCGEQIVDLAAESASVPADDLMTD
ncbi:MAG: zinc ribbon domain-containing protein [Muribaculaceae bacterium]|nr:zinc ribbon domain-containing protein [Muribaculaceae bacterium]